MTKLSDVIHHSIAEIPGVDEEKLKIAQRVSSVRMMWKELVDPLLLAHTNGVYIFTDKGQTELHVYVDESIFASELNNQRELLKLQYLERFNEQIDDFQIHISRGRYKSMYPFIAQQETSSPSVPLSREEFELVDEVSKKITDAHLRETFKKAMIRDLEWKKGENDN